MAYTYEAIETQVRANVNDAAAVVSQEIDDAINILSNFFSLKKIDATQATVAGQEYLNIPSGGITIERVKIGDDEYKYATIADLQHAEDNEEDRWYEYNGKIQILPTPTSATAAKIWYKAGFTALRGAGSTDIPDRLVPLLVILATWLYYVQMVTKVISQRESYPDVKPDEIEAIQRNWKKAFDELIGSIKNQKI